MCLKAGDRISLHSDNEDGWVDAEMPEGGVFDRFNIGNRNSNQLVYACVPEGTFGTFVKMDKDPNYAWVEVEWGFRRKIRVFLTYISI